MEKSQPPASVIPRYLEIFTGPMGSGKSRYLLNRLWTYSEQRAKSAFPIDAFKPKLDTRDGRYIVSRAMAYKFPAKFFDATYPQQILDKVKQGAGLVVIDEAQFVDPTLVRKGSKTLWDVVNVLRYDLDKHVLLGGLNFNFRGEEYGDMGRLAIDANRVHHLTDAICNHPGCHATATRTQRYRSLNPLVPSHYNDPVYEPGAKKYVPMCVSHLVIPGHPRGMHAPKSN